MITFTIKNTLLKMYIYLHIRNTNTLFTDGISYHGNSKHMTSSDVNQLMLNLLYIPRKQAMYVGVNKCEIYIITK